MSGVGRVAVVTGAAQGIGRALAVRLAQDGHGLVLCDVQATAETEALVAGLGAPVLSVRADVSDEDGVAQLRAAVAERFGHCDVLVNNAATGSPQALEDMTLATWRHVVSVNLDSVFLTCRAFLPSMREQGWGRVVNLSSNTLGLVVPGFAHYIASKGGVVGLTRALASEYGTHGVTVNAIAPGLTRTPATVDLFGEPDAYVDAQAIKRVEEPADVVGALSFLVSDDAAFMTGQTLTVDGGLVR